MWRMRIFPLFVVLLFSNCLSAPNNHEFSFLCHNDAIHCIFIHPDNEKGMNSILLALDRFANKDIFKNTISILINTRASNISMLKIDEYISNNSLVEKYRNCLIICNAQDVFYIRNMNVINKFDLINAMFTILSKDRNNIPEKEGPVNISEFPSIWYPVTTRGLRALVARMVDHLLIRV